MGLALLAAGLAGSLLIAVWDSPLQWVTRTTQVLGTVYMCVAGLATAREGGATGMPLAPVEAAWRANEIFARVRRQTAAGWVRRYGLAAGAVAAGLGLRALLAAWVGPGLPPIITFYPVIMMAAMLAGFGPAMLATAMTDVVVGYGLLAPLGQFAIGSPVDRLGLVIFTGVGVFMGVFADTYRRRRDKAAAYDREEALRESRARLATFAVATFEGIVESEEGRILDCNEQFARMVGYPVTELRGADLASLIDAADRDTVLPILREGLGSELECGMLHTGRHADHGRGPQPGGVSGQRQASHRGPRHHRAQAGGRGPAALRTPGQPQSRHCPLRAARGRAHPGSQRRG